MEICCYQRRNYWNLRKVSYIFVDNVFYNKIDWFHNRICELVEKETVLYYKMDPDPFDDRHPSRSKPGCTFGPLLKSLFKDDDFMNRVSDVVDQPWN